MLKSYFFIPASKEKFIKKIDSLRSDYFIFDLEDAISVSETKSSMDQLSKIYLKDNYFVRPRIFSIATNKLELTLFSELLNIGFKNFLIPKIIYVEELNIIKKCILEQSQEIPEEISAILLVENPRCLINLERILEKSAINICGVTLGSHDYTDSMGMKHTFENLSYSRNKVLNTAKAFGIKAIDIASMNIFDENFDQECHNAFHMGYDGKFILHPHQLEILNTVEYFTQEEILEAQQLIAEEVKLGRKNFSLININGKIFEKAHLRRAKQIIAFVNSQMEKI